MPELPEVEIVRAGLQKHIAGRRIRAVDVLHPRAVRRHLPGAADFTSRLASSWIASVRRRGKYLWLELGDGDAVLAHLGMSGQLLIQPDSAEDEKHLRIRVRFDDDGPQLRFVDQRTFGGLVLTRQVSADDTVLPAPIAHIARDPMDPRFDPIAASRAIRRRRTEVKRALLDQTLVSGIGNIYADEALWRTRVHGTRPTARLSAGTATALLAAVSDVLTAALRAGGTSFDALYVNVNGESGYFDRSLDVYGRAGMPCRRCGSRIRREPFMNRSSYSCPRCQRRPPQR